MLCKLTVGSLATATAAVSGPLKAAVGGKGAR